MRKVYRGRDIEVSFDLDICIHVGECLRGEPRVFKLERRPWALPDAGEADAEAHRVGDELWGHGAEPFGEPLPFAARDLELEDEEGDGDGEDAVREGFHSVLGHGGRW